MFRRAGKPWEANARSSLFQSSLSQSRISARVDWGTRDPEVVLHEFERQIGPNPAPFGDHGARFFETAECDRVHGDIRITRRVDRLRGDQPLGSLDRFIMRPPGGNQMW